MDKRLRLLIGIVVLILLGSGYYIYTNVVKALPTGIAGQNGRIVVKRIDVATLYSGKVEKVLIEEGEVVKQNQALATLQSAQTTAQLENAHAQVTSTQQAVVAAQAALDKAQQQLKIARLEYTNASQLRKNNLISSTEYQQHLANYNSAKAQVESAQSAVAQAQAQVSAANAQLQAASTMDQDMTINAPIAGRIEYRLVDPGNVVATGAKIASILDPTNVYINIFLPTEQVNQLKIGQEARIILDGVDAVFPASVTYVDSQNQFTPKSVETADERTKLVFKVKLQITHDVAQKYSSLLKSGMPAMGYVRYDSSAAWPSEYQVKLP
ncbi:HlyD family secretion protein [Psittacicella hinzii]|uniref:Multidrug resistance protein MdtA-like barrel-sandwich hybrid domain-containing protein n=1 Tax=Psittacicella hinzii TaxID=2028575 RepID=A0A3A1Y891_9GAMM|nr:HlyD family efflux transporter periplasmic adaptor subunit [Psittacicella hinzii]RIY34422.1 hypothetical protein CKF58_08185 [Psittacicella hinzii]